MSLRQYSRVWQQACRGVCQSQQWPHLNRWDQGCQQCVTLTKCDHIVTASLDQCDHSGATSAWNPPNQWPIQTQHRHNMTEGDQMFKVGKFLETKQGILQREKIGRKAIAPHGGTGSTFAKINRIRSSPSCFLLALVRIELDKGRFIAVHSFAHFCCIVARLYCDERLRAGAT